MIASVDVEVRVNLNISNTLKGEEIGRDCNINLEYYKTMASWVTYVEMLHNFNVGLFGSHNVNR